MPAVTVPGLQLVPPTADLAEQVMAWRNHPDVRRWFLTTTLEDLEGLREWYASYDESSRHVVVAVLDGQAVGTAGIRVANGMGQTGHETEWEGREGWLSYAVDPAHAGRGIGTALARDALDHAFGRLGLRRVQAGCFADNAASWKVMAKLGMRREQHGVQDSFHAELGWVDGYTYAILAEEWTPRSEH